MSSLSEGWSAVTSGLPTIRPVTPVRIRVLRQRRVNTPETMFSTDERELNLKHIPQVDFPFWPS